MNAARTPEASTTTTGLVIRTPIRYDLRVWWHTAGRATHFRDEEVRLARIQRGDRVLDVGCGTGSLAIAAARVAGREGRVVGIDPSPEMIRWARTKARLRRAPVEFIATAGEALPFPAASFDVVTVSLVLHQLPSDALHATAGQIRRVLAADGRLLAVDLGKPVAGQRTVHSHRASHGDGSGPFDLDRVGMLFEHLGLTIVESGDIPHRFRSLEPLRYLLAVSSTPASA